jgi:hypothetical protein
MSRMRWLTQMAVLVAVCAALALPHSAAAAEGGIVPGSVVAKALGTFNGVAYTQYNGEFVGTTAGDYAVGFEIVAPADPTQGNGIAVVEAMHVMGGTPGRDAYFTPEFFYSRGFTYAAIWWHPADTSPFDGYSTEEANQILHNFALALRQDPATQEMVGTLSHVYGFGVSKATEPFFSVVASPAQSLYDLTVLIVPSWPHAEFEQPPGAGRIIVFNVEGDRVRSALTGTHVDALRGSSDTYRSYEVAGGAHMPDLLWVRAASAVYGMTSEGTSPLDWTPVLRALFIAGHRWTTEGVEPPPSTYTWDAPFGQIDPVYESVYGMELATGINRDEMGNGLGGIQLPDLAIGRGVYIPCDPASFFGMGLYGAFLDKQCEPLEDGSPRFAGHAAYVEQFSAQAETLVGQGFLLREDADQMVAEAGASNVGDPSACTGGPAALLPATGVAAAGGAIALSCLMAVAAAATFRKRRDA